MQDSKNSSWLKNSPLSLPNYRNLWIGQSISTFGDRFTSIALPILVYELTGQAWQLGFAFMLQVLAALVFGLWAGALSDRWDKRRTMIVSDIAQSALVLIIPLILSTNLDLNIKLTVTYAVGFLISAVTQFFRPAKIAIIPQLVDKERLVDANAWDQGATHFTQFLGYTISGFLIASTSTTTAFYVDAATFMVSAFFISRIQTNYSGKTEQSTSDTSIVDSIREGLAQAIGVPLIRAVLILGLIVPMAFGGLQPLILV
ncbi:MAG: MFS transporter, partial [Candidatus Promineifilaceae bacterium]